jgi:EmrB/QacA subfamily drug resistance transporter
VDTDAAPQSGTIHKAERYMLSITILVPTFGRIADIYGRKNLYVAGFGILTFCSLLCGLAHNGVQLLIFRLIQSIGGSMMLSNSTAIVTDAFPKKQLGKALGINSMVIAVGNAIGPILGGLLIKFGWQWIFFFNVPIGIIGTVWAFFQLKEVEKLPEGQKLDYPGTITFMAGLFLLLLGLTMGGIRGWTSLFVLTSLISSVILLVSFIYIENKVDEPMLDLRLFKSRILSFAYISTLLNSIGRGSLIFLLVFYLHAIKGMTSIQSGILLSPFALAMMIVAPISGALYDKYGSQLLGSLGLIISSLGLLGFMHIGVNTSIFDLILWMVIMGGGSGLFNSPNTSAIMSSVPADRRGIAGGTRTMLNNAGAVISIALSMAATSSSMVPETMHEIFTGKGAIADHLATNEFITGLRIAFGISFVFTIIAAVISYLRGPNPMLEFENENKKSLKGQVDSI